MNDEPSVGLVGIAPHIDREIGFLGTINRFASPYGAPLTIEIVQAPSGGTAKPDESTFVPDALGEWVIIVRAAYLNRRVSVVVFPPAVLEWSSLAKTRSYQDSVRPIAERLAILRALVRDRGCDASAIAWMASGRRPVPWWPDFPGLAAFGGDH